MQIAGIVAEYNPFHNGHSYHIQQTRAQGATHIVAVMSGSFMQRGDIALCSKWARARMALLNSVDLVIELPVAFALSSANTFAFGGVYLLSRLGCTQISFGSESNNIPDLVKAANLLDSVEQSSLLSAYLKEGNCSFAFARQRAAEQLYGSEDAGLMLSPNNALGIEYIRAINKIGASMRPLSIKRQQASHDSSEVGETIASASYLRECMKNDGLSKIQKYIPENAYSILKTEVLQGKSPVYEVNIQQAMLYKLRTMHPNELALLPDVSEGLENRLYAAARKAKTVDEFYSLVKTKRYTHARIRRIAYCALLGITKSAQEHPPQYIRVLGATRGGMEILAKVKATAQIPIGVKFADLYKRHPRGIDLDVSATDIYALAQPTVQPCGMDFTGQIITVDAR